VAVGKHLEIHGEGIVVALFKKKILKETAMADMSSGSTVA
jgi:hypothetical protein